MYTVPYQEWIQKRILLADDIISRYQPDRTIDAELIMCCAISGLAAMMWPGEGIDKFRFTQFLVKFCPPEVRIQTISLYHLIEMRTKSNSADAQILISKFFSSRREYDGKLFLDNETLPVSLLLKTVFDASAIDQLESSIISLLPNISLKEVRASSYAAIIYSNLRNSLVHEYKVSELLASHGPMNNVSMPSYANINYPPDETEIQNIAVEKDLPLAEVRASLAQTRRRLFFPYAYIRNVTIGVADAAFRYWNSVNSFNSPLPSDSERWINGGKIV
jgi:hypothetical protein